MLFIKGNREQPRCGFTNNLLKSLTKHSEIFFKLFLLVGY